MSHNTPIVNDVKSVYGNVVCIKCGKPAGSYEVPPIHRVEDLDTKLFMCYSHIKQYFNCPSCGNKARKSKPNTEKSDKDNWIYTCECSCGRNFESIVGTKFLKSIEEFSVVKRILKTPPKKDK